MVKYHDGVHVQTLVGGTRFKFDQKRLESDPCQVCLGVTNACLYFLSCEMLVFIESVQ